MGIPKEMASITLFPLLRAVLLVDYHPIDIVISTLQSTIIPDVSIDDYRPLVPSRLSKQQSTRFLSKVTQDFVDSLNLRADPGETAPSSNRSLNDYCQYRVGDDENASDIFFTSSPNVYRDRLSKKHWIP